MVPFLICIVTSPQPLILCNPGEISPSSLVLIVQSLPSTYILFWLQSAKISK